MRDINVGLIGFGTIGTGVVEILLNNSKIIEQRVGSEIVLKKIADLDIETDRMVNIDKSILTRDANSVISDPEIDIVIELIGGYEPAKTFMRQAIYNKKSVVTANKALLAKYGSEIFNAAYNKKVDIGFEASVGGGIPVIRTIREAFAANNINSVYGIVNGTANYILSKMTKEGGDFHDILKDAQKEGYAEADPTFDIEGVDSAHKIAILASIAFGYKVNLESIYTEGISRITPLDIQFADEFDYIIKLLAFATIDHNENDLDIRVHPTMIPKKNPISNINGVFNAIKLDGDFVGENILIGKGAGSRPTASAVVGDLIDIARNINNNIDNRIPLSTVININSKLKVKNIKDIITSYYIRLSVVDKPGVLSTISGIFGDHYISIASVIQKGRKKNEGVPLVFMTHFAREEDVKESIKEIKKLETVLDDPLVIRVQSKEEL